MELLLILVVLAMLVAVGVARWRRRPSEALRARFGQEYDRLVAKAGGDHRRAETQLRELSRRRAALDVRELPAEAKRRYTARWREIQLDFVEDPGASVAAAGSLVDEVTRDRGYPDDDERERLAMLSLDHPRLIENYRTARAINRRNQQGSASIDLLRVAFRSYRALFVELVGDGIPLRQPRHQASEVSP